MVRYANGHYFDEESKRMFYMLGAFYSCYIPKNDTPTGVIIRCRNEELLDLIKRELESDHTVVHDSRGKNSHWIQIRDKHLRYTLEEKGLVPNKKERKFPENMGEEYIDHFIRGFFDGQAHITRYKGDGRNVITLLFNKPFLIGLNNNLKEYAGVDHERSSAKDLTYGHRDAMKIYKFIYRDWDFIEENKLYTNLQKDKFNILHKPTHHSNIKHIKAVEKMEKAVELAMQGKKVYEISKILNYSHPPGLCQIFKKIKGQTIRQYIQSLKKTANNLASV